MAQESIGECEAAGNGRINEPIECCSYRSYFIAHSMHNKGKNVTIFKINSIRNWNSLTSITVEIECKRGPVNDIPKTTYTEAEPLIVFIIFSNALLDWQEKRCSPFRHQMQFNNTVISSVFIFFISFHFVRHTDRDWHEYVYGERKGPQPQRQTTIESDWVIALVHLVFDVVGIVNC